MAEVTRASIDSGGPPGSAAKPGRVSQAGDAAAAGSASRAGSVAAGPVKQAGRPGTRGPVEGHGLIERVMSTVIRKLAWSRLANPRVAVTLSGCGLLLGALVGAMAPNTVTLPIKLPLTQFLQHFLPSLRYDNVLTFILLYAGDILACLGLAGMLWAHSQGLRPDPRKLLLVSAGVVAVLVSLTPVGSSDTASYAAFGRISALGGNPYTDSPFSFLQHSSYLPIVGHIWQPQPSNYGPISTRVQPFAATIGGADPPTTICGLMILHCLRFL